jgi:hypothetical protein
MDEMKAIYGTTILFIVVGIVAVVIGTDNVAVAQQPTDPMYWCSVSRSQVSNERDAALAQIEALKLNNAALAARVRELEAKAAISKETKPNE